MSQVGVNLSRNQIPSTTSKQYCFFSFSKYCTNFCKIDVSRSNDKYKRILYMCSDCNYICGTEELNNHRNKCTGGNAASGGSRSILKAKQKVPAKSNAAPGGNQDNPKVKKKVSSKSIAAPEGDQGDTKVKKTVPPKSVAAPDEDQGDPKVKKTIPPKIPPEKSPIRNDDDEETVSTAGSYFEEQSDMLTEEIDNTTASVLEGQSATLTCEAIGENAAPDEDQDIIKVKETVPSKNKETGFSEIGTSKPDDKVKRILYMCSDCRYICGSLLSVKNHKKTCTGEKMPSNKELPADLKTSMYVCPLCDFYCPSEARMKLHYKFCNGGKVSIACQTGDNSQSTSRITSSSVILSPRPFSSTDTEDASLPEGKMSAECQTDPVTIKTVKTNCDYCDYSSAKPGNLQKHMKIHTGEKNFLCPYCARRFREKSTLKIHERTHTGARPYVCDICEKTFASLSSWNKHKIRLHTVERPFVCNYCRMGFKFKYDLRCHIRTHSSKIFPGKQYKKVQ